MLFQPKLHCLTISSSTFSLLFSRSVQFRASTNRHVPLRPMGVKNSRVQSFCFFLAPNARSGKVLRGSRASTVRATLGRSPQKSLAARVNRVYDVTHTAPDAPRGPKNVQECRAVFLWSLRPPIQLKRPAPDPSATSLEAHSSTRDGGDRRHPGRLLVAENVHEETVVRCKFENGLVVQGDEEEVGPSFQQGLRFFFQAFGGSEVERRAPGGKKHAVKNFQTALCRVCVQGFWNESIEAWMHNRHQR